MVEVEADAEKGLLVKSGDMLVLQDSLPPRKKCADILRENCVFMPNREVVLEILGDRVLDNPTPPPSLVILPGWMEENPTHRGRVRFRQIATEHGLMVSEPTDALRIVSHIDPRSLYDRGLYRLVLMHPSRVCMCGSVTARQLVLVPQRKNWRIDAPSDVGALLGEGEETTGYVFRDSGATTVAQNLWGLPKFF